MIFSATSAFRMMNYGCGCKFCFFPCMCCCEIPIGGNNNSVQPETVVVYPASSQAYPNNQSQPYGSAYPQAGFPFDNLSAVKLFEIVQMKTFPSNISHIQQDTQAALIPVLIPMIHSTSEQVMEELSRSPDNQQSL